MSSEEERGSAEDSGSEMGEKSTEEETASGEDSAGKILSLFSIVSSCIQIRRCSLSLLIDRISVCRQ